MFDYLSNCVRVAFAVENDQVDAIGAQRLVEFPRTFNPMTVCDVPCIAQSTVYSLDVVLIFSQDGNRYDLSLVQMTVSMLRPWCQYARGSEDAPISCKGLMSLTKTPRLVPAATPKP